MNDNVDWKNVVPNQIQSLYCKPHTTVEDTFPFIKHQLITQPKSLHSIYTINEGFENRLQTMIHRSDSFESLLSNLKQNVIRRHIFNVY